MFSPEKNIVEWRLQGINGGKAIILRDTESTHSLMKEMAKNERVTPGTLIVADSQSSGRGRHERTWKSPKGKNLYFNILVPLEGIPPQNYAQITQVAAIVLSDVFKSLESKDNDKGPAKESKITVKWPNDILFGKAKFCGILAEILILKNNEKALNLGIGININSTKADYADIEREIITLSEICNKQINRERLLQTILWNLERALGQFKAFGIRPFVSAWRKMDKFIGCRGTIVIDRVCTEENRDGNSHLEKKSGKILDMNDDGSLLFECDDGEIRKVYSADLEI